MKKAMESILLQQIQDVLRDIYGDVILNLAFPIGEGARVDMLAKLPDGNVLLVEIKSGSKDDYLPISTYSQMIVYKRILSDWHHFDQEKITPVIVTTRRVPDELKKVCDQAGIIVVPIPEDGNSVQLKATLRERLGATSNSNQEQPN